MKRIVAVLLIVLGLSIHMGCGAMPHNSSDDFSDNQNQDTLTLTDEQAIANAKRLNEKYNLDMDHVFNLIYGSSKVETDGYNKYIVQLVYQYENSNRQLKKHDLLFYFAYDPTTDTISFNRICFWDTYNFGMGDQDGWAYLKNMKEFSWGIDPATSNATIDTDDNVQDLGDNLDERKTLYDYINGEESIDGSVGDVITVTGTIAQNSGTFPTWCIELDSVLCFRDMNGNDDTVFFNCNKLFLYDEDNFDGIPFSAWESEVITVTGILENYRGVGEMFLYNPSLIP